MIFLAISTCVYLAIVCVAFVSNLFTSWLWISDRNKRWSSVKTMEFQQVDTTTKRKTTLTNGIWTANTIAHSVIKIHWPVWILRRISSNCLIICSIYHSCRSYGTHTAHRLRSCLSTLDIEAWLLRAFRTATHKTLENVFAVERVQKIRADFCKQKTEWKRRNRQELNKLKSIFQ